MRGAVVFIAVLTLAHLILKIIFPAMSWWILAVPVAGAGICVLIFFGAFLCLCIPLSFIWIGEKLGDKR